MYICFIIYICYKKILIKYTEIKKKKENKNGQQFNDNILFL